MVTRGQRITFETLYPSQSFYGTYKERFEQPAESKADPEEVYYEFVEGLIDVLEGENLGVRVSVSAIPSHMDRYALGTVTVPSYYGDPIHLASGAFTESVEALSVVH